MAAPSTIHVIVVDDHRLLRKGIRYSLQVFDDIELVAEADSGEQALRLSEELHPDVVLMDLIMPGMNGVETTRLIRERNPQVQVIVLSGFEDGSLVQDALRAGAIGYLLKNIAIEDLAAAIRSAYRGSSVVSPAALQALAFTTAPEPDASGTLTERERQVLALLVRGMSNVEIAKELMISLSTARSHVSSILSKLGAANRAEAAVIAVKNHLVP
jgi:NarL family two-component system response regulator LiaR